MKHIASRLCFPSAPTMLLVALALALCPTFAHAATWTGGGDKTNWSDANNWDPVAVPGAGADVVITNVGANATNILLTADTAVLNSFTITNAVLTFISIP